MRLKNFLVLTIIINTIAFADCSRLKFKTNPVPEFPGGPDAIFSDDFPFQISEHTPDINLALPKAKSGNKVLLLPAGEESFEIRYHLLEKAQYSIKVLTYILYSDPVSRKFINILLDKQKQGVEVKLVADCYTKFIPKDRILYAQTEKQGLDILGYEPIIFSGHSGKYLIDADEYNQRFHEKYIVVDNYAGITGGSNIAQEYALYMNKPRNMWRDQDVLVIGPVAEDMAKAVDEEFNYFSKKELDRPELINPKWYKKNSSKNKTISEIQPKSISENYEPLFNIEKFDDENVTARLIRTRPRFEEDYIYQAYIHLFKTARKRIILEIAYFVPDEEMLSELLSAQKRGVKLTLITNNAWTNDVFEMHPYIRYFYLPLMQAGATIYEWQGIVKNKGSLHSKCAIFDDDITIVGSYNLDPRGRYLNSEDIVVIKSEKVANSLLNIINQIVLPHCQKITIEQAEFWHNPTTITGSLKLNFSKLLKDFW